MPPQMWPWNKDYFEIIILRSSRQRRRSKNGILPFCKGNVHLLKKQNKTPHRTPFVRVSPLYQEE